MTYDDWKTRAPEMPSTHQACDMCGADVPHDGLLPVRCDDCLDAPDPLPYCATCDRYICQCDEPQWCDTCGCFVGLTGCYCDQDWS